MKYDECLFAASWYMAVGASLGSLRIWSASVGMATVSAIPNWFNTFRGGASWGSFGWHRDGSMDNAVRTFFSRVPLVGGDDLTCSTNSPPPPPPPMGTRPAWSAVVGLSWMACIWRCCSRPCFASVSYFPMFSLIRNPWKIFKRESLYECVCVPVQRSLS